jgi:hypothetical protein
MSKLQSKQEEYAKNQKADIIYRVITNKPRTPKSPTAPRTPKSPTAPRTPSVQKDKSLTDNSMIKLSINDYDRICKDKDDTHTQNTAILLNISVSKLNAICKNTDSFREYIDSLPITKKEKDKVKNSPIKDLSPDVLKGMNAKAKTLLDIPDHLLERIIHDDLKPLFKYNFREWIPGGRKLKLNFLSLNPNAIDFLSLPKNKKYINYSKLCENTNPRAIGLLAEEINANPNNPDINWQALSKNPDAIDILDKHRDKIEMRIFSSNTNPKAIQIIKELRLARGNGNRSSSSSDNNIDWINMSANTSTEAINFLSLPENYNKIEWDIFSGNTNPKAIEMLIAKESEEFDLEDREFNRLKSYEKISWEKLSKNPKAISLLEKKWEEEKELKRNDRRQYNKLKKIGYIIDWTALSVNVKAIDLLRRKIEEENKLTKAKYDSLADIEKINWWALSANPEAIQLLKANRDKINWVKLGTNPKAIKLLEEELKVKPENIYWYSLSRNPEAGELLKRNSDKIVWSIFSENPKAGELLKENPKDGELLKERIEFEDTLTKKKYDEISNYNKLNWNYLSINPSIFTY